MKMKKMMAVVLVLMMAGLMTAQAVPTLQISSGGTTVTVVDQGSGDQDPTAFGVTSIITGLGGTGIDPITGQLTGWSVNVSFGQVTPNAGLGTGEFLHYSLVASAFPGAGALTVLFSDDSGLTLPSPYTAIIGGTLAAGATLSVVNYYGGGLLDTDTASTSFSFDNSNGGQSILVADRASGEWDTPTWTLEAVITPGANGGTTSFDESKVPDGGSTVMLLGSVLAALGFVTRSFKARS